ncbi:hypothetical protein LCGC14_0570180 [marine sediment metagenome]|uniref:Uncharacterized protein n=1 Tax=marine sediment metagenome TaxID=412755 RepID=A0A0F9U5X3_9ZZZZ
MITNKQIRELVPGTEYWVQWWHNLKLLKFERVGFVNIAGKAVLYFDYMPALHQDIIHDIKTIEEMG